MSKIVKIIVFLICIVVLAAVAYTIFAYKDYVVENRREYNYDYPQKNIEVKKSSSQQWLSQLSDRDDFAYPATEASFSIDFLKPKQEHQGENRFVIKNLDDYMFFCLKEILETDKIDFATSQTGSQIDVILYLSASQTKHTLRMLDYYGIKYNKN